MNNAEDCFHLGVKALIRDVEGKILLLKVNPQKLHGKHDAYWDIPGGRLQRGDTIEQTLRREVAEEIGVQNISNIRQVTTVLSKIRIPLEPQDVGLILTIYSCEMNHEEPIQLSDEHVEYGWFTPKEAADKLQVKYPAEFTDSVNGLAQ